MENETTRESNGRWKQKKEKADVIFVPPREGGEGTHSRLDGGVEIFLFGLPLPSEISLTPPLFA